MIIEVEPSLQEKVMEAERLETGVFVEEGATLLGLWLP